MLSLFFFLSFWYEARLGLSCVVLVIKLSRRRTSCGLVESRPDETSHVRSIAFSELGPGWVFLPSTTLGLIYHFVGRYRSVDFCREESINSGPARSGGGVSHPQSFFPPHRVPRRRSLKGSCALAEDWIDRCEPVQTCSFLLAPYVQQGTRLFRSAFGRFPPLFIVSLPSFSLRCRPDLAVGHTHAYFPCPASKRKRTL